jgi:myo-inositol-1(or 4)-monophosphatase
MTWLDFSFHGTQHRERLQAAASIAREAGALALRTFQDRRRLMIWRKEGGDVVSNADIEADFLIKERLHAAFPQDKILSEEGGGSYADDVWIIDPVDGTWNFTLGIPHWCVSIAFMADAVPRIGIIYDACHDELFAASTHGGASLNGQELRCTPRDSLKGAHIAFGHTPHLPPGKTFTPLMRLAEAGVLFRAQGAGALSIAYIAAGRLDGFFENAIHIWDCAASMLILTESGGQVSSAFDRDRPVDPFPFAAARPGIFEPLREIVSF